MTGINIDVVRARAREIRAAVQKIHTYTGQDTPSFMADERNLYTVMHLLLICIEAAAGLCNHLLAKAAGAAPGSFAECFEGLRELGILDPELTARMVRMARFRNVLVHRYWNVQPEKVLEYARDDLGDLDAFLAQVGRWTRQQL